MADVKETRDGYGDALLQLGAEEPRIAVVDADLFHSTRTDRFAEEFPDRFFEIGIAEQDMVSTRWTSSWPDRARGSRRDRMERRTNRCWTWP